MEEPPVQKEEVEPKEEPRALQRKAPRDEDAAELNLGPEFSAETAQPLFLAEASQLLHLKLSQASSEDPELSQTLRKSLRHLERFDSIQGQEAAVDVRRLLEKVEPSLHPFEVAQLASLVPKDAEEAKAIIPSLQRTFEDDTRLNDVLKALDNFVR